MNKTLFRIALILLFVIGLLIGTTFGQGAAEVAPQEEVIVIDLDLTPSAPVAIESISHEDRTELHVAQENLVRADSVFQYVLRRLVVKYKINTATHGLNIMSGEILPINPLVDEGTPRTTNVR